MLLLFLLFCLNCKVWTQAKINYPFIFEFDARHSICWHQLSEVSFILSHCLISELLTLPAPMLTPFPFGTLHLAQFSAGRNKCNVPLLASHPHRNFHHDSDVPWSNII